MVIIIAKKVEVYSFPLGDMHRRGYEELVRRVCEVKTGRGEWTGVLINDTVLTSGLLRHDKEFDVEFYRQPQTSGFLLRDFGDILEIAVGNKPNVEGVVGVQRHPLPNDVLFVIGNFFGKPWELASCKVDMVGACDTLKLGNEMDMDTHVCGAPVFNRDGALVGICEAYVPLKDNLVIRFLSTNQQGLLQ